MKTRVQRFNERVPWPLRLLLLLVVGFLLKEVLFFALYGGWAATARLRGRATLCPWSRVGTYYLDQLAFDKHFEVHRESIQIVESDEKLDIQLVSSSAGFFWMRQGVGLLYLLAEQDWLVEDSPNLSVRPGDIVFDCEAHVGVFTAKALALGAAKVVAIEPNPTNLECLRRNFPREIKSGRVVLVPEAVWSSEGTVSLHMGVSTAQDSLVRSVGGETMDIPATTIDRLVERLGLDKVDYIKMDIEGAEREALKGALETLRHHRPRLMLDSYHRKDDSTVLPKIIREANADYQFTCGPCEAFLDDGSYLVPHATFYE